MIIHGMNSLYLITLMCIQRFESLQYQLIILIKSFYETAFLNKISTLWNRKINLNETKIGLITRKDTRNTE